MALELVGHTNFTRNVGGNDVTVVVPAGTRDGDVMFIWSRDDVVAGFTLHHSVAFGNGAFSILLTRTASAEPGAYLVGSSNGGILVVLRGFVETWTPGTSTSHESAFTNTVADTGGDGETFDVSETGFTSTAADDSVILYFTTIDEVDNSDAFVSLCVPPAAVTELVDAETNFGGVVQAHYGLSYEVVNNGQVVPTRNWQFQGMNQNSGNIVGMVSRLNPGREVPAVSDSWSMIRV